jgi:hypothetical protein
MSAEEIVALICSESLAASTNPRGAEGALLEDGEDAGGRTATGASTFLCPCLPPAAAYRVEQESADVSWMGAAGWPSMFSYVLSRPVKVSVSVISYPTFVPEAEKNQ